MGNLISLKQGESKVVEFTVRNKRTLELMDLQGTTLFLGVKRYKSDTSYLFSKTDDEFTTTDAASGQVSVLFTEEDTNQEAGILIGELRVTFSDVDIEKSDDLFINIEHAVTT